MAQGKVWPWRASRAGRTGFSTVVVPIAGPKKLLQATWARAEGMGLDPREQYIGVYENPPSSPGECVIVTDRAIYIDGVGARVCLLYDEMESFRVTVDKQAADRLTICLRDGRSYEVPITGGRGLLRDVWAFLRFLMRVIDDRASAPAGDPR